MPLGGSALRCRVDRVLQRRDGAVAVGRRGQHLGMLVAQRLQGRRVLHGLVLQVGPQRRDLLLLVGRRGLQRRQLPLIVSHRGLQRRQLLSMRIGRRLESGLMACVARLQVRLVLGPGRLQCSDLLLHLAQRRVEGGDAFVAAGHLGFQARNLLVALVHGRLQHLGVLSPVVDGALQDDRLLLVHVDGRLERCDLLLVLGGGGLQRRNLVLVLGGGGLQGRDLVLVLGDGGLQRRNLLVVLGGSRQPFFQLPLAGGGRILLGGQPCLQLGDCRLQRRGPLFQRGRRRLQRGNALLALGQLGPQPAGLLLVRRGCLRQLGVQLLDRALALGQGDLLLCQRGLQDRCERTLGGGDHAGVRRVTRHTPRPASFGAGKDIAPRVSRTNVVVGELLKLPRLVALGGRLLDLAALIVQLAHVAREQSLVLLLVLGLEPLVFGAQEALAGLQRAELALDRQELGLHAHAVADGDLGALALGFELGQQRRGPLGRDGLHALLQLAVLALQFADLVLLQRQVVLNDRDLAARLGGVVVGLDLGRLGLLQLGVQAGQALLQALQLQVLLLDRGHHLRHLGGRLLLAHLGTAESEAGRWVGEGTVSMAEDGERSRALGGGHGEHGGGRGGDHASGVPLRTARWRSSTVLPACRRCSRATFSRSSLAHASSKATRSLCQVATIMLSCCRSWRSRSRSAVTVATSLDISSRAT